MDNGQSQRDTDTSPDVMYEPWEGDPGSVRRDCRHCGGDRLWRDLDVGQEVCLDCRHYAEFDEDAGERVNHQTQYSRGCPECGADAWLRKTKSPDYRCMRGHEFDELAEGAIEID